MKRVLGWTGRKVCEKFVHGEKEAVEWLGEMVLGSDVWEEGVDLVDACGDERQRDTMKGEYGPAT